MRILFACLFLFHFAVADLDDLDWISIDVPPVVEAGVPFTLTMGKRSGIKMYSTNFESTRWNAGLRLYLASSPGDKISSAFYSEDCYLINEYPMCDPGIEIAEEYVAFRNATIRNVTIPASVGPSGQHYVIVARVIKTDGSYFGSSMESQVFNLTGGTSDWGSYQLIGQQLWGADGTSCNGYDCIRKCADKYDRYTSPYDPTEEQVKQYRECANSCPGVYINASSTIGGQPTAALTRPTQCSTTWASTTTEAEGTSSASATASQTELQFTNSRSAGFRLSTSIPLLSLLSFFVMFAAL